MNHRTTRRSFLLGSAGVGAALALDGSLDALLRPPPADAAVVGTSLGNPPLSEADLWRFADRIAERLGRGWDEDRGAYYGGDSEASSTRHNSHMLLTHATAARRGHSGPARNDRRARLLARRLCESPPFRQPGGEVSAHTHLGSNAWSGTLDRHLVTSGSIDSKVMEALMYAWRARGPLRLPQATLDLIQDRIDRVARSEFWRYPNSFTNQINWNCEVYAVGATVVGAGGLLRKDYRNQIARFAAEIAHPRKSGWAPNLGPGYRFVYSPKRGPGDPLNIDSAEYANITCHFLHAYEQALRAGMQPLASGDVAQLRAWVTRILAGYWTHAGYLNWDTGHGLNRWHSGQFFAFAQQSLLAIAAAPRFWSSPHYGAWCKYLFDRGLALYERLAETQGDGVLAPGAVHGVDVGQNSTWIFASRMQANAARAISLGLAREESRRPPPMYSFDEDIGRLAVTTPSYSTAVMATSRGAFSYGGLELARLYGRQGQVIANVGGSYPAGFGIAVKRSSGAAELVSQRPRSFRKPPLRLLESPQGTSHGQRYPRPPLAGGFEDLKSMGAVQGSTLRIETHHRFRADAIDTAWIVLRRSGDSRYAVEAAFPTWGRAARVIGVMKTGERVTLGQADAPRRLSVGDVRRFELRGPSGGYDLIPTSGLSRAQAFLKRPPAQDTNPSPGPSLMLEVVSGSLFERLEFAARVVPR